MDELISPFCQVAGEVAAKADDTPVFSVIDPVKRILMGQGHLWMERTNAVLLFCSATTQSSSVRAFGCD